MRIAGTGNTPFSAPLREVDATDAAAPSSASSAKAGATASPLQSAVLQPAVAALKGMPEIDMARVNELRDALAKGEVPFDAAKLAGLIQRFHGSKG